MRDRDRCMYPYSYDKINDYNPLSNVFTYCISQNQDKVNPFNQQLLEAAADEIGVDRIDRLIYHGARAYARDKDGNTPLMIAAKKGNLAVVYQLLKWMEGYMLNMKNNEGETALALASSGGHVEIVDVLLLNGANPNIASDGGVTPLMEAASADRVGTVSRLLESPFIQVNAQDNDGSTALMLAATLGQDVEIMRMLIANGADPRIANADGLTPLMMSVARGRLDAVKLLLAHPDIDVNIRVGHRTTLLMKAVNEGYMEIVDELLKRSDIDINAQDDFGITALMIAAARDNLPMVRKLLERGADKEIRNIDKKRAIDLTRNKAISSLLGPVRKRR